MENKAAAVLAHQYRMMVEWVTEYIDALSDEDLKMELSPGKNHGVWILGHMIVSDDDFSVYMGKGELLYPRWSEKLGQRSKLMPPENYPPVPELREMWKKVCEKNFKIYETITDEELPQHHALYKASEPDYFKTKDRVIMSWQLHQMYHAGQLAVLLSRAGKSKY